MSNSFETALDNVKLLARLYEEEPNAGKLNEAQTRFTYIDNMLFDVLGWDRHDCVVEDRLDGRIADYSLSAPHRIFIVEAKRTSIGFILPATAPGTRIWKIRTLESEHPEIFAAIQQAAGYTSQRGTPFGAVTNGHQFIGFLGSRTDGIDPLDGRAYVFHSLHDIVSNFKEFWDAFSKPGVTQRRLQLLLQADTKTSPPSKLATRLNRT